MPRLRRSASEGSLLATLRASGRVIERVAGSGSGFILLTATVAHFVFSPLGFNPTDDGWVLAGARRILEGAVPHRDVISPNIGGSLYLHAPFVALAGDSLLWISRAFVWFEFAVTAWIWARLIHEAAALRSVVMSRTVLALVGFVLSAHTFPLMAWRSIDALFVGSIGVWLAQGRGERRRLIGYLLLGLTPLLRQNFLFVACGALILLGGWRKARFWIAASLPLIVYLAGIALAGGGRDLFVQLTAYGYRDLLVRGVLTYVQSEPALLGLVAGLAAGYVLTRGDRARDSIGARRLSGVAGAMLSCGVPIGAAATLATSGELYVSITAFFLFGLVGGLVLWWVARERRLTPMLRIALLGFLVSWSLSVSLGWDTPALGSGILVQISMMAGLLAWPGRKRWGEVAVPAGGERVRYATAALLSLVAIASILGFARARTLFIYREAPASALTRDLGEVLPGAVGIRTNERTYAVFKDLLAAKRLALAEGSQYAILPEMAVNWATDPQKNQLPVDWALPAELPREELVARVIDALESQRGELVAITQRFDAELLAIGWFAPDPSNPIVAYVRTRWTPVGETEHYVLYA